MDTLNPQLVVYVRIVLYLFTAMILFLFSVIHRERIRRLRNFMLAVFMLTVAASLMVRIVSGAVAQTIANDYLTTPALMLYAVLLAIDFWHVSRSGKAGAR